MDNDILSFEISVHGTEKSLELGEHTLSYQEKKQEMEQMLIEVIYSIPLQKI